jgi:hypothetical protein
MALWTPTSPNGTAGTLRSIESEIDPADRLGWSQFQILAMNDHGQIAGIGHYDLVPPGILHSSVRGFLLTPVPEPTIIVFTTIAGALWMFGARRFRGLSRCFTSG